MKISGKLIALRAEHNLTQEEMGKIAGASNKAVSSWEKGVKTPRMRYVQAICSYFGIDMEDFLDEEQDATKVKRPRPLEGGDYMSTYETKMIFSKNLNDLIQDSGKSRAEIAKEMNVTVSAVGWWCSGEKMPRMDKIEKLAELFGVEKYDLLEEKSLVPQKSTRDWLEGLLAERGVVKPGVELTGNQTEMLIALVQLIDACIKNMGK